MKLLLSTLCFALSTSGLIAQTSEATYQVNFDATWSSSTHPNAYPNNAHFSPLIGATHKASANLWQAGQLASNGIESMAETGNNSNLTGEINALRNSGQAGLRLLGGAPNSPGSTSITFTTTDEFPLVSLVTMIAPSPDWFVGVDSLSLMDNGVWVDKVVTLYAWDAGTDSGTNFTSGNQNTNPQEPIFLITQGPFTGADPLGTLTFTRQTIGSNYCSPAVPNSTGLPANMLALGSAVAGDPLTLAAESLPTNQFGYFLVGSSTGTVTPIGSSGILCLGGTIGRFNGPGQIQFSASQGQMQLTVDPNQLPLNPPTAAVSGSTYHFQCWFREDGGNSNFTDGLSLTFL